MPGPRENVRVYERRAEVASMYIQGKNQYDIARSLHVSQPQISNDLRAIRQAWLNSSIRDFDAAKAQELAKIDEVEREAWEAWKRSKTDKEVIVQERSHTGSTKVSKRSEGQAGGVQFLDLVLKCIEKRCDILGLSIATTATKELAAGLTSVLAQAKTLRIETSAEPPSPYAEA